MKKYNYEISTDLIFEFESEIDVYDNKGYYNKDREQMLISEFKQFLEEKGLQFWYVNSIYQVED